VNVGLGLAAQHVGQFGVGDVGAVLAGLGDGGGVQTASSVTVTIRLTV
jgi:hypothetical protein